MTSNEHLPLLPLALAGVPPGLRLALAQEGVPTCDVGNRPARFVLFDSQASAAPPTLKGQQLFDVDGLRSGFDVDPFAALVDRRAARRRWIFRGVSLGETAAAVDKRRVRRRLLGRLRTALEDLGGIWIRLASAPYPYRAAFNFRIDYDEYDPGDFRRTLDACEGHESATSHYICGSSYEPHADALARFEGLDVGAHGYWHHTYQHPADNRTNIERGLAVLRRAGLAPSGFVAPHGRFNLPLAAVLAELGISHSSEFALAFDEVPFAYPATNVLQLPIHPVCLGTFLESGASRSTEELVALATVYLSQIASVKAQAREPIFLYGHPTRRLGRYPQLLTKLFAHVDSLSGVWKTTLSEFQRWWGQRQSVELRVETTGNDLLLWALGPLPVTQPFAAEIVLRDGVVRRPLVAGGTRLDRRRLEVEARADPGIFDGLPTSEFVVAKNKLPVQLREHLRAWLDWERTTPIHEITPHTWRHRVKRALRKYKERC